MRYVAAFRTHILVDHIARLAAGFFGAVPSARQVVLADESRGPMDVPTYEKVPYTEDTNCLELPNHPPGRSLWFNGDRKSTRLNSSHLGISYAVFCLKKKKSSLV